MCVILTCLHEDIVTCQHTCMLYVYACTDMLMCFCLDSAFRIDSRSCIYHMQLG